MLALLGSLGDHLVSEGEFQESVDRLDALIEVLGIYPLESLWALAPDRRLVLLSRIPLATSPPLVL